MATAISTAVHEIHLAGQRVPAGQYRDIDTGREICLEDEDYLPASLDGRVAAYTCIRNTWRQHRNFALCQAEAVHPPWQKSV